MTLTSRELRVVEEIQRERDRLIALASDLIGFDTTAYEISHSPRDEARLQEYLAVRLRAVGAEVEVWEPSPEEVAGNRLAPAGLSFAGRPQLLARIPSSGKGRSVLLNGHIDVVSSEPRERWSSDPNRAEVRDGKLYGRGACDMKGGIAAMIMAVETLSHLNVSLAGDLLVCTVTDEESTGAGGAAAVEHGVRADAALIPEPSAFDVWIACRGSLIPTISVLGRPGHAGFPQPAWEQGGAVNAIEKMGVVMDAMRRLHESWHSRSDNRHLYLSPGDIIPTVIAGGEWIVSVPASCQITYHVAYLPGHADEDGWGSRVEAEIIECIQAAASSDSWLRAHPPTIHWDPEVPSAEVSENEPIVPVVLQAAADVGRTGHIAGMDNWHDGATFTRLGGTPSICFGPGDNSQAHVIDEYVAVDDLVACAQAIALTAMRFCE